jgi:hypothetical protein
MLLVLVLTVTCFDIQTTEQAPTTSPQNQSYWHSNVSQKDGILKTALWFQVPSQRRRNNNWGNI